VFTEFPNSLSCYEQSYGEIPKNVTVLFLPLSAEDCFGYDSLLSSFASFCCAQSLDLQMKIVSDKMQDGKQKAKAADSDESFQGKFCLADLWKFAAGHHLRHSVDEKRAVEHCMFFNKVRVKLGFIS